MECALALLLVFVAHVSNTNITFICIRAKRHINVMHIRSYCINLCNRVIKTQAHIHSKQTAARTIWDMSYYIFALRQYTILCTSIFDVQERWVCMHYAVGRALTTAEFVYVYGNVDMTEINLFPHNLNKSIHPVFVCVCVCVCVDGLGETKSFLWQTARGEIIPVFR